MDSWTLFRHLNVTARSELDNAPLCLREVDFPPMWHRVSTILGRIVALGIALMAVIVAVTANVDSPILACLNGAACLLTPALLLVPSLGLWVVPLGMTLGAVIVREREGQTWDLLRVAPLDLETLVLCKARGALWWLIQPLRNLRTILVFMALLMGIGLAISFFSTMDPNRQDLFGAEQAIFYSVTGGLILLGGALFLVDRVQQLVLMVLAALATSASTRSVRTALSGATVGALVAWGAEVGVTMVLLAALPDSAGRYSLLSVVAAIMLGPTAAFLIRLPFTGALLLIAVTLLVREIAVRALWQGTLYAARRE